MDLKEILLVGNLLVSVSGFILVKFNDLRHLAKDFEKLQKTVEHIDRKLDRHEVDIEVLKEKVKN